jgi:class 3 adenylate cyclase
MLRLFSRRPNLRSAIANLDGHQIDPDLQERFATFLEQAEARELCYLNPRYLAERLKVSERATLKLMLAALYEGIVNLHWDVRCPACGAVDHRWHSLDELHYEAQCEACQKQFSPRLDDEVRVTFSLHPRLRMLSASADDPAFRARVDAQFGPVPGQALLLLPDFQRLFPQQRLLPDESLLVTRAALLFTDLAGSTALYARRGDPRAYHLVRLHFDELFRVADAGGGVVVKTIGDAILAVFQTPIEALHAALEMQCAIAELNTRQNLRDYESLILKAGLHSGPCLSVTLNERPDYFGTTVNIAARVQGLSRGNDLICTEAIRTDREAQAILAGYTLESSHVRLKGIDEEVLVHRLELPAL